MKAAAIEELNRERAKAGLKPLPVPGQTATAATKSAKDSTTTTISVTTTLTTTPADPDAPSTLETREAAAYDNFRKVREAEEAKRRRDARAAEVKKQREREQRSMQLAGKGLGDADSDSDTADATKDWLKGLKKRQKQIQDEIAADQEKAEARKRAAAKAKYNAEDLKGVRVGHDIASFEDGTEQILTLKDATIDEYEEEGDELEAVAVKEQETLAHKLEMKKKKPAYNPMDTHSDEEVDILAHYNEEIKGKKKTLFTLGNTITASLPAPTPVPGNGSQLTSLFPNGAAKSVKQEDDQAGKDEIMEFGGASVEVKPVQIKKPKKKRTTTRRKRAADDNNDDNGAGLEATTANTDSMDIDSEVAGVGGKQKRRKFADADDPDEELQARLMRQRLQALKERKPQLRPEDLARQLREEGDAGKVGDSDNDGVEQEECGMIIDDMAEFFSSLKRADNDDAPAGFRKLKKSSGNNVQGLASGLPASFGVPTATTNDAMEVDSQKQPFPAGDNADDDDDDDDDDGEEKDHGNGNDDEDPSNSLGIDAEKTIAQGLGATLGLLRERGLVGDTSASAQRAQQQRQHQQFLVAKRRLEAEFEEEARRQREHDRASGRLDRMTQREREEHARQQNAARDQLVARRLAELFRRQYRPTVDLRYVDEHGRALGEKDAFKMLSHQFHGKGSGKKKTEKLLKRIEDEHRREARSILDASQNVGMSSATAQQTKKRKEAGVRLA